MKLIRCLFLVLWIGITAGAQELQIITEEDPPYNFTGKTGEPEGFAVDLVKEIQKRLGLSNPIKIYPWARGYNTLLTQPNVVLFTVAKTKERERLFQWVGPILENRWILIGKKSHNLKISSWEDMKKIKTIGVVRDFAWDKYLTEKGFTNLQRTVRNSQNVLKLNVDRIDAYVSSDHTFMNEITGENLNPEDYEVLFTINTVQLYLAQSSNTAPSVVASWQKALDEMKSDGTFTKILKKWLPNGLFPGPAQSPKN